MQNFENQNKYTDYKPHCTIAYLKPGTCKKYVEMFYGTEFDVKCDKLVYSYFDNSKQTKKI